jgi:hypothetical protein
LKADSDPPARCLWRALAAHFTFIEIGIRNFNNLCFSRELYRRTGEPSSARAFAENRVWLQLNRAMRRISRIILLQEGDESFDPYIAGAAAIAADDYGGRFACGIVRLVLFFDIRRFVWALRK